MTVKNIECQIAINQITRFLYGEGISEEVERDLKKHLANCAECVQALERRKALLQAMLKHDKPAEARPRQFIKAPSINLVPSKNGSHPDATAKTNVTIHAPKEKRPKGRAVVAWKPIAYCGTLAIVMFGMSYVMRDPTRLFGARAGEDLGPTTNPTQVLSYGPETKTGHTSDNVASQPSTDVVESATKESDLTSNKTPTAVSTDSRTPPTPANTVKTAAIVESRAAAPAKTIQPATTKTKTPVKPVTPPNKTQKPVRGTLRVYAPDGTVIVH